MFSFSYAHSLLSSIFDVSDMLDNFYIPLFLSSIVNAGDQSTFIQSLGGLTLVIFNHMRTALHGSIKLVQIEQDGALSAFLVHKLYLINQWQHDSVCRHTAVIIIVPIIMFAGLASVVLRELHVPTRMVRV